MDEKQSINEVLAKVQSEVNVPKANTNKFGGYNYRNLEDINAVAKKVCEKYGASYYFTDSIVPMTAGNEVRWYLKSECHFSACGQEIIATAYAREAKSKKGMDDAQVTGLASSYARKYAACAMFAIDSGDEIDSMDNREEQPKQEEKLFNLDDLYKAAETFAQVSGHSVDEVMDAVSDAKAVKFYGDLDFTNDTQVDTAVRVINNWVKMKGAQNND